MRQAIIPWARLDDFVQRDGKIEGYDTVFKKYTHHRRRADQLKRPSKDAWVESIV